LVGVPIVFGTLALIFRTKKNEYEDVVYYDNSGHPYEIVDLSNGMEYARYIDDEEEDEN
jgi:hypothetical protein